MDRNGARAVSVRNLSKSFDGNQVLHGVDLDVEPGTVTALLGPSGCGKTTLLRSIAGLTKPDEGTVVIGDTTVVGPRTWVQPEHRQIGMVFQEWALFPHLSVGRNVAYGLRRDPEASARVGEMLELVGLSGLEDRSPSTLSGGQQQRVALARALAPRPSVLLLDEPFSNLDSAMRVEIRAEVHRLLAELGITAIFVTHDQEEAFVLGEQVAVVNEGHIEQVGTPHEIYENPASRWIAEFVGVVNFLEGTARDGMVDTPLGPIALDEPRHGQVEVVIRPEHLVIGTGGTDATVELVEFYGHDAMLVLQLEQGARLHARVPPHQALRRGEAVTVRHSGVAARSFGPTVEAC